MKLSAVEKQLNNEYFAGRPVCPFSPQVSIDPQRVSLSTLLATAMAV